MKYVCYRCEREIWWLESPGDGVNDDMLCPDCLAVVDKELQAEREAHLLAEYGPLTDIKDKDGNEVIDLTGLYIDC